ncbi:MAG TPA: hypothetical protein VGB57_10795 [Allosphingosinicella sp.]|jgi:hypothetical protein
MAKWSFVQNEDVPAPPAMPNVFSVHFRAAEQVEDWSLTQVQGDA